MANVPIYINSANYKTLDNLQGDTSELFLRYIGWEKCRAGHRFGPNKRLSFILHIIESGRGFLDVGGRHFGLEKGDSFLIFPETEAWYCADWADPWTYRWIGFDGYRAFECVEKAGFTKETPVIRLKEGTRHILESYMEDMLKNHGTDFACQIRRKGDLMLFMSELASVRQRERPEISKDRKSSSESYVYRTIDYINNHYRENIRIEKLAGMIGVDRSYLSNNFRSATGISPKQYLLNVRMETAKTFLRETGYPVSLVSNAVGYDDPLAFSKMFRKKFGISPSEYREKGEDLLFGDEKIENYNPKY